MFRETKFEYRFEPELHRSAAYDGSSCIGECDYVDRNGAWAITHTMNSIGADGDHRDILIFGLLCHHQHELSGNALSAPGSAFILPPIEHI